MTSIPCSVYSHFSRLSSSSSLFTRSSDRFCSPFLAFAESLGLQRSHRSMKLANLACGVGKARCWFKFGNRGVDAKGAGIYGSQSRDDFDREDVEQYFNYTGMLAVEGSYDKMEALLNLKIHPLDILLMLAASEGDKLKIEELLRAGAKHDVRDADGRTALDRGNDEIKQFIIGFSVHNA